VTLQKIVNILDELSPFELQDDWDNSGLQVGSLDLDIDKIYVTLDIDSKLIDEVEENSLIITHHPLIFKGLKKVDFSKFPANIIQKAILKNVSIVSMHTNYDKTHLNRYVLERVLGFKVKNCEDYLCYFDVDMKFDRFCEKISNSLGIQHIKTVNSNESIKTAAICTGSGASLLGSLKADCLLTGDIKYHEAFEAKENKISLIEIGHYESEVHFGASLKEELQNYGLFAIIANSTNPFRYNI
jgi:dinuclear metal center YbgI/SA1388 family protein